MKYDCLFIGNAIVDILTDVSFEFMNDQGIEPGSWRPVEKEEIEKKPIESLLNYECEEDDDGTDWET